MDFDCCWQDYYWDCCWAFSRCVFERRFWLRETICLFVCLWFHLAHARQHWGYARFLWDHYGEPGSVSTHWLLVVSLRRCVPVIKDKHRVIMTNSNSFIFFAFHSTEKQCTDSTNCKEFFDDYLWFPRGLSSKILYLKRSIGSNFLYGKNPFDGSVCNFHANSFFPMSFTILKIHSKIRKAD